MMSELPDWATAQLSAWRNAEVLSHFTADEIRKMPTDEFARLTGRPTPAQAAFAAIAQREQDSLSAPPAITGTPTATDIPEVVSGPQGIDINSID